MFLKRIQSELKSLRDPVNAELLASNGISLLSHTDDLLEWIFELKGMNLYDGQVFQLRVRKSIFWSDLLFARFASQKSIQ